MRYRLASVVCVLGLVGCATDDPVGDDTDSDTVGETDPATDTDPGPDTDGTPRGLTGLVIDAHGRPIPNTTVLGCTSAFCLQGVSTAAGRFQFDFEPPELVALKTHEDVTTSPRRGAALRPCVLVDEPDVDVGTLYAPDLPEGTTFPEGTTPQAVDAGGGLELTLRRRDLTPAFGDHLDDLAAALLPPEHVPTYPELEGEEVLAVYALHPFAANGAVPIPVRAPSDLPPDTVVKFRTISEIDGSFSAPVLGRADGTSVSTDGSQGITHLTYLVISR